MIDFSEYPTLCEHSEFGDLDVSEAQVAAACDIVREACGWHIAPLVEDEIVCDSAGSGLISLPTLHVVDVTSVVDTDGDRAITDFEWSVLGLLERKNGARWPRGRRRVRVEFDHGLAATPGAIRAVVGEIADSLHPDKVAAANLKQVALDGASLTYWQSAGIGRDPKKAYGHVLNRYSL